MAILLLPISGKTRRALPDRQAMVREISLEFANPHGQPVTSTRTLPAQHDVRTQLGNTRSSGEHVTELANWWYESVHVPVGVKISTQLNPPPTNDWQNRVTFQDPPGQATIVPVHEPPENVST
jgi:hypothetical protein